MILSEQILKIFKRNFSIKAYILSTVSLNLSSGEDMLGGSSGTEILKILKFFTCYIFKMASYH